jgi:subfamily B ATP-binding cassette protein MsbA
MKELAKASHQTADTTPLKRVRIRSLLRPHRAALSVAFVAVVFEGLTDLLDPWPLKVVLDYVLGSKRAPAWLARLAASTFGTGKLSLLTLAAASVIVIALVNAVSTYAEKYLTTSVGQRIMHELRNILYHHIHRLSLSYHDRQETGDLIVRVTSDIDAIQDFISTALLGIIVNLLTLVGMLCVMFYLDWSFTLISLAVTPLLFVVVYTSTRRIKSAARAVKRKESRIASVVQESLSSIRIVKAFAREDYEERRLARESLESVELALRARSAKAKLTPAVELIVAVGTCLVLWYGAHQVLAGRITAGAMMVFILYLGKMYKPMRDLSKMTDTLSKSAIGFERVREILGTESLVRDQRGARQAPAFKGLIEFEHVDFGYTQDRLVLSDLNLRIEPGQSVALVGPTGAGKTTIVSLISRLYDPLAGSVKIDGEDVRRYTLKSLRSQISFVLQESCLFRASIWENIAYGKLGASREEIVRAAKLANAHEFIEQLPEGYDTVVGERGETLSGGQRQRIAIARAVIRGAPILLLDEPSSGLDAESERIVFEALGRLMEGKTSVVIAHRLSTIRRADAIFVVRDGTVVEHGKHEELLERGGLYAQLYETQFKPQEEDAFVDQVPAGEMS